MTEQKSPLNPTLIAKWIIPAVAIAVAGTLIVARSATPASPRIVVDPSPNSNAYTVSVVGTGHVTGAPDTLTISMGISNHAAHATDCLAQNNQRTAALIATLRDKGVAETDIQTSNISVAAHEDNNGTSDGFDCNNGLTVTIHDLSKAGAIIDAAAVAGGDSATISGMSFSISNQSPLLAQARAQAMQDASAQATQLAEAANAKLGGVRSINESTSGQPYTVQPTSLSDAASMATSVPVQAGTTALDVQVTVVYDLAS